MSSRQSHRLAVSTLVLAILLGLAAPAAQAGQRPSLLDALGAKVQTWLAAWLPGGSIDNAGLTDPNGRAKRGGQLPNARVAPGPGLGGRNAGRAPGGGKIRVECSGQPNPDGGCTPG